MHVYLFSPIPYTFLHQRPQKFADQFCARSIPVTFIEPCGFTEYLAGRKRGLLRLLVASLFYDLLGFIAIVLPFLQSKPRPATSGSRGSEGMIIVGMPLVIPNNRVDSRFLERWNASIYRQVLKRRVFAQMQAGENSIAIVQNPFWGLVLREGDFSAVYYDCLDEITLFSGRASAKRYAEYERSLVALSRRVFVTAEKLEQQIHALELDVPVVRIPNGVDYHWFQERVTQGVPPSDVAATPKPRVGYVGVLRSWLDYDLVGTLANALPEVSFLFVGPLDIQERIAVLRSIPNIHWLGRKEYLDVPAIIGALDVCLIPFEAGKVSQTTNPVKIFEYFALGKPVVATPLHELEPFSRSHLVYVATTPDEYIDAVRHALAERDPAKEAQRREIARQHSWHTHVDRMIAIFSEEGDV